MYGEKSEYTWPVGMPTADFYRQKVISLEHENKDLNEKLQQARSEIERLQTKLQNLDLRLQKCKNDLEDCKATLEDCSPRPWRSMMSEFTDR